MPSGFSTNGSVGKVSEKVRYFNLYRSFKFRTLIPLVPQNFSNSGGGGLGYFLAKFSEKHEIKEAHFWDTFCKFRKREMFRGPFYVASRGKKVNREVVGSEMQLHLYNDFVFCRYR